VNELRVKEHFRAQESLIAHVDLRDIPGDGVLVDKLLELVRLHDLSSRFIECLLIEFLILADNVLADISESLLDLLCNIHAVLSRHGLASVSELLENELCDVLASKWDVLNAASNDEAVRNGEDVGHTITGVDNCSCQIACRHGFVLTSVNLSIQSEGSLDTNEESLDIEGLEHDLCHLLSVLRGVEWRLCQDEAVLFRLTSQLRVDSSVPELFHSFPVLNLPATDDILKIVGLLMLKCLVSDVVVELWVLEFLILACNLCSSLLYSIRNDCWDEVTRLHVASVAHFGIAGTIVNDDRRELAHF
jgi:hypothetical protein